MARGDPLDLCWNSVRDPQLGNLTIYDVSKDVRFDVSIKSVGKFLLDLAKARTATLSKPLM
jgi:polyisoprenoid-binding protein YceI